MRAGRRFAVRARRALLALLLLAAPAAALPDVPPGASGSGAVDDGEPTVRARLLFDAQALGPDGSLRLGVLFEMERGWHIYWRNPGDTGFPTRLSWHVPYAEVGPTLWPAPEAFLEEDDLTTYGYGHEVLLVNEAQVAAAPGTPLDVAVDADFLVCRVQCIPGRIRMTRRLPVATQRRPADAETLALFETWSARVPVPASRYGLTVDGLYSQSAIRPGDDFRAAVSLVCEPTVSACPRGLMAGTPDPRESFAPFATPSLRLEPTGTRPHPFAEGLLITLAGHANTEDVPPDDRLRGVAQLRSASGEWMAVQVDVPLPRAAAGAAVEARPSPWLEPARRAGAMVSAWQALGLALLGGLILNLMPCVLPVLAIKVFGIAERAHARRREVVLHGVAYTSGILLSMAALAALVIALRAAGTAVGWGFQFQEPAFIAAISSLLVVFALNLFGVFEIGLPAAARLEVGAGASGLPRSFFEGLLAVALATPCSAPFLGTAVGFAFASPAPVILGIFLAVGLGLASPFVAVSLLPGLARWLPRSGPWMIQLRAALGFALLATVVWLLWIAGRVLGADGMTLLLGFLVALSAAVWIYGARQRVRRDGRAPLLGLSLAAAAILGLVWLPLEPHATANAAPSDEPAAGSAALGAPFAREAVAAELALGRPVFVAFTADWCLTCKVNERVVLNDARVLEALEQRDVATFVGDWTRRDETIRAELARFGRAGVPMYLVYDPRRPDRPELLPELLTVDRVLEALAAATPAEPGGRGARTDGESPLG
jgi:thiol:disulfide interchange protein DsbD